MGSPTVHSETRLLAVMWDHCTVGVESEGRVGEKVSRGICLECSGERSAETSAQGRLGGGAELVVPKQGVSMLCKDKVPGWDQLSACPHVPQEQRHHLSQGLWERSPCVVDVG